MSNIVEWICTGKLRIALSYLSTFVISSSRYEYMREYFKKLEKKHGKCKGYAILAHKLGRAVYYMLKRGKAFEQEKFLRT